MKIENFSYVQNMISSKMVPEAKGDDFEAELERELIKNIKNQQPETQKENTNVAVEEFRNQLTSMGAVAFFQEFNAKKIEDKLEEKRIELEKTLGLDESRQPPLEGEERQSAMDSLEEILQDYEKELQEQITMIGEFDKKEEFKSPLSSLLS